MLKGLGIDPDRPRQMSAIIFPCDGPPRKIGWGGEPPFQHLQDSCTLLESPEMCIKLFYNTDPTNEHTKQNPYLFGYGDVFVNLTLTQLNNESKADLDIPDNLISHVALKLAFNKHVTLNPLLVSFESMFTKQVKYAEKHLSANAYKLMLARLTHMRETFQHNEVQNLTRNGVLIPRTVRGVKAIVANTSEIVKFHWPRGVTPLLPDLEVETAGLFDFANPNLHLEADADVFSKIIRVLQASHPLTTVESA